MKVFLKVLALAAAIALALTQTSCMKCECTCHCEGGGSASYFVNKNCKLESADASDITEVDLDQGDIIVWTNLKATNVTIKFDVLPDGTAWMLPGELTIPPMSNATSTIRTGVDPGDYGWTIHCDGAESSGKIHLPPPQPGSGGGDGGG
jgi:hypothetical protein